ncbi:ARM repeat-containing protein [Ramaria rubella]|nr:ARM repeat-containing protein [Ramaria rubella]
MDPTFIQNLHSLLQQTTAPDTNIIKAATASLSRDYYKNPLCIPALFEIIATSPETNIRQLAAVELRKRTSHSSGSLWEAVVQDTRQTIKSRILDVTFSEQNALVRHATARVVAAIAEIEIPLGQWPTLLPSLLQTATSAVVAQRETGAFTLCTILEKTGTEMQEQLPDFFKLFSALAHDNDSLEVRVTSVRALGALAEYIDADEKAAIRQYQEILPNMITVLGQVIEAGDEKSAREIFDVFDTLLILEAPLLSKHVPQLVQFLLLYAANRSFDSDIRNMTLNALNWTVKYKRSKIQSNNLAASILEGLLPVAAEPIPEDPDDDSPSRCALRVIDVLALSLPASQVFPPVRMLLEQYMVSGDPSHRRAALMMLGTCVEGITEFLIQHMQDVWQIIDRGLSDADAEVRKAACTALGCLCEHCEEECAARHEQLMPAILTLLSEPTTQKHACIALDSMLEILPNDVEPYLNPIMERLVALLDTVPIEIKSVIMGAIGSAAHSAKERFVPYFQATVAKVQQFLTLGDAVEEVELKGITMDALGTFAQAVGKETFQPYFADLMKQAFVCLESGNPRLAECSFITFDVLADVFGEDFAPYLPTVVPAIIKSLQQPEHGLDDTAFGNGDATDFASGDSSSNAIPVTDATTETEVEVDVDDLFKASSAICIEKQNAAGASGTIFVATKRHFLPYVEQVTLELLNMLQHFSDGVRKAAFDSLFSIIQVFYQLSEPTEWVAGLPVQVPLHQNVRDLVTHILPKMLEAFSEDDEKTSVSTLFVGLAETINEVGPAFVENHIKEIFEMVGMVLEQKAVCQMDPDQEAEEELPEDQAEEDSMLISAASDVVAALATALGPQFTEPFQTFFPLIIKYYGKNRSVSDRSSTVGCMGEIVGGMKGAITPFTEPILQLLFAALSDSDPQVQSNGAFASGMLVENSEADLSSQYLHLLAALRPLFEVAEGSPSARFNARDNATGAVARLILKNTAAVPLDQVLPTFMAALPLKNDFLENRPVFRAVFHLVQSNPSALSPHIDHLLSVFSYVLNPESADQLGDETRTGVLELIASFNAQAPEKIQAAGLSVYLPSA